MAADAFEQFLDHLTRTMRLSASQRRAIAAELRDHYEARLQELGEGGLGPQQCIDTALEEFGEAHTLAHALARPHQRRTRRQLMQTLAATAAAAGIAAAIILSTGAPTPQPAHKQQAASQDESQPAPPAPRVLTVNDAQINADAFALDQDLRFLAQSDAVVESGDGEALPLLTVYGLNFSRTVPPGVYRETTWPINNDPYRIQVPGTRGGTAEEIDPLLAEKAAQAPAGQLLFAELSSIFTPVAEGSFHVTVSLQDAAGGEIDRAEIDVTVHNAGFFVTPVVQQAHTLQNHLLVFSNVDDATKIAKVSVSVADGEVTFRELQQDVQAQADPADDEAAAQPGRRVMPLETQGFSRQAEMAVLSDAIADLNRSMDLHRRFFEKALADPGFAEPREMIRARWKMQSLQSLRGELQSRYTAYLLSC